MSDRMTTNERMDALMNPTPRGLDDSDRNILAELAGEADEPCARCETPVRPKPTGPMSHAWEFETDNGDPLCEECVTTVDELLMARKAAAVAWERVLAAPAGSNLHETRSASHRKAWAKVRALRERLAEETS